MPSAPPSCRTSATTLLTSAVSPARDSTSRTYTVRVLSFLFCIECVKQLLVSCNMRMLFSIVKKKTTTASGGSKISKKGGPPTYYFDNFFPITT